jgi:hypothetical protein
MEDFLYVLIAAVVFLGIMLLITAFVSFPGPVMNVSVATFSVGEVGYLTDYPTKTIDLKSFSVGETQEESLKAIPQVEVYRNIFSAKTEKFVIEVPEWYETTMRGVRLNFNVLQDKQSSGQFSRLVIKWNGLEVFRYGDVAVDQSVFIEKDRVKSSNTLEIDCEYNPWWFWATSTYTLRNFNVNLDYGPERYIPFTLLASELQGFNRGEINFDGSGCDLVVKVNGINVYQGTPSGETEIDFTYQGVPLTPGGNMVAFVSTSGICNLRNAEFKIFLVGNQVVATRKFDLITEKYNLLNQGFTGKVNYKIDSIMRTGSLTIKLNGGSLSVPSPKTGWNSATFTVSDVQEGENEVSFSGTGAFDIAEARIELER